MHAQDSEPPLPRWVGIDVLRGFSVILVVLHHTHLRFHLRGFDVQSLLPKPVSRVLFWSGHSAVIMFFVISGFLITQRSIQRWGSLDRMRIADFYRMRAARILPCLLALLAVLSVLHWIGAKDYAIPADRATLSRAVVAALSFHVNWLEGARGYLPGSWDVLWSLSVEEAFYVVFPLLCIALRSERALLLAIAPLFVLGPITRLRLEGQVPWDDYAYLSCADGIALGCLAAVAHARGRFSLPTLRLVLATGIALCVAVLCFRAPLRFMYRFGLGPTLLELGTALMLVPLARGVAAGAFARGGRLLRAIGRASYEIYLTHMFVVFSAARLAERVAPPSWQLMCFWYVPMLACSAALGLAIARWYSEPANRALRADREPDAVGT